MRVVYICARLRREPRARRVGARSACAIFETEKVLAGVVGGMADAPSEIVKQLLLDSQRETRALSKGWATYAVYAHVNARGRLGEAAAFWRWHRACCALRGE